MKLKRVVKHLLTDYWSVRRAFPASTMKAIEQAIRETEAVHQGQIRFAVEASLDVSALLRGQSARSRAIETFSRLGVWDTERNNGVLIYLLLADRDVEVIADRGIHERVGTQGWEEICRNMERAFKQRYFQQGVIDGIRAVSGHLARHYPAQGAQSNELPDTPVVL